MDERELLLEARAARIPTDDPNAIVLGLIPTTPAPTDKAKMTKLRNKLEQANAA